MTIVLATRNRGKIIEIRDLLARSNWEVQSCENYPGCPIPEETGRTFEENALLKAHAIAHFTGELTLADDSGLEVDALDGAPGIYSARFSGEQATDTSNIAMLLERINGIPDEQRTARFRCVVAIVSPEGRQWTIEGVCGGHIGTAPRGRAGFGYDPLFIPDGYRYTFGELGHAVKNRISHRAQALHAAYDLLRILEAPYSESSSSTIPSRNSSTPQEEA